MEKKVIIIGAGPSGISASLYLKRSNFDVTVIYKDLGALAKTDKIENYYGFSEPISGVELEKNSIEGAKRLGVNFIEEEVVSIGFETMLTVSTTKSTYSAPFVIIATGSERNTPRVENLSKFERLGVSYCAICDAFFYRKKKVAVLGNGELAKHEINDLLNVTKDVTLLTNGNDLSIDIDNVTINKKKISKLDGQDRFEKIIFEDNSEESFDGLFVAYGSLGTVAIAKKIGAKIEKNHLIVNENMQTNIPNLYACGDCTGGILQINKAVYEGAKAALNIIATANSK